MPVQAGAVAFLAWGALASPIGQVWAPFVAGAVCVAVHGARGPRDRLRDALLRRFPASMRAGARLFVTAVFLLGVVQPLACGASVVVHADAVDGWDLFPHQTAVALLMFGTTILFVPFVAPVARRQKYGWTVAVLWVPLFVAGLWGARRLLEPVLLAECMGRRNGAACAGLAELAREGSLERRERAFDACFAEPDDERARMNWVYSVCAGLAHDDPGLRPAACEGLLRWCRTEGFAARKSCEAAVAVCGAGQAYARMAADCAGEACAFLAQRHP
jgi:hypothetical protein